MEPNNVLGGRKMLVSCLVELQTGIFTAFEAPTGTSTRTGNSSHPSGKSPFKVGSNNIVPPSGQDLI